MTSIRKTALVAGILYLITEVTAIAAMLSYGSVLTDPAFIIDGTVDNTRVLVGAFLEVLLAIAVVGSSVTLYPVIKSYGPGLALGYVAGRLIEAAIILLGAISLLTVVTLQSQLSSATDAEAVAAVTVGQSMVAVHDWTFLFGPKLALGVNTVLLAFLMFRSQLVPRVIAILGLVGGSLVFLSGTAVLFGAYPDLSTIGVAAAMPVLAWELSFAFWMIIRGFRNVIPNEAATTVRPPAPAAA